MVSMHLALPQHTGPHLIGTVPIHLDLPIHGLLTGKAIDRINRFDWAHLPTAQTIDFAVSHGAFTAEALAHFVVVGGRG